MGGILDGQQGINPLAAWESLEPQLAPSLRGPFAYLCGCRHVRMRRLDEAAAFFKIAQRLEKADALASRLAAKELERLVKSR